MKETCEERYLQARAQGATCAEASRQAGYSSRPPHRVRQLAAKLPALRKECRWLCATLDQEIDQLTRQLELVTKQLKLLRRECDQKRSVLALCAALEGEDGTR